ncbi:MAG: cytidine/deoxycytidylate deaminase family protein [Candidatus Omnitrophota bacterium]
MPFKGKNNKIEATRGSQRPSWDEYFMRVALLVSERSTCLRRRVGAVLVKDRQILATGYNGAPKGVYHCENTGCLRENLGVTSGQRHEICRGLHAEQNVILQAASFGVSTKKSVIYITNTPCSICAKMIINAGIKEVITQNEYPDKMAIDFLKEAGIVLRKIVIKAV